MIFGNGQIQKPTVQVSLVDPHNMKRKYTSTLPESNIFAPENRLFALKGNDRIRTIHFQGRKAVSFKERNTENNSEDTGFGIDPCEFQCYFSFTTPNLRTGFPLFLG